MPPHSDNPWAAAGEIVLAWALYALSNLDKVLLAVQILAGLATIIFTVLRIGILWRGKKEP